MEDSAHPKRSVTVADVAKAAKVSKATAARVLGGYGVVSAKITDQVMAAAAALEYRPNELARSMSTGRSGIIGVVVGDIENAFFSLAVRGISDAARLAGFNVIIANSGEELDAEKSAVDLLIGKRVDGLIVTPARCDSFDHLQHVRRAGVPLVLFDRAIPELDVDAVTGDDREAAIAATRYLIGQGHRRLAYVSAMDAEDGGLTDIGRISNSAVRERVEGFVSVLTEAGLPNPLRYVRLGATNQEQTDGVIKHLLSDSAAPTALLASDSLVGLRIFKSLQSLGLSIPKDVSMISFLDADWTSVTVPPITIVDQRVYEMGKLAGERLIARIERTPLAVERLRVSTSLVVRGSVATISR
ncbi:substrate-binding domain-containing protein [Rhizobium leguminosarum bv. viciae]|jgi:LacI family transcriptional regulator|uniref:Substrate-binding domain-containing protein n=1 Tax=Rhizobium leguminosarum bv. viciae TaxID=387 RepID=A0A8I2GR76_RHILV|nr:LacI family DNA-binding transcriptional regulator [Rhizobium leguminosarum]MBY5753889.1 LacI family transcriptional regulator [Rhizobium leguminosarum]MBY5787225.1 LacI family transcriptional regulator [Rhizobium leguminosarum]MBY5791983.1 LacI family transcriptional regulator [Rhizobium leguminosarum]MBY5795766.1 LacI family transcriptional regulator [Rhizobium leguminosarum]MBY5822934.1 LacI family transcriptional regulator [Rhizobium leguminosarum]